MFIIITLLSILSGLCYVFYKKSLEKWRDLDGMPGPKPLPILGNLLDVRSNPEDLLNDFFNLSKKYDKVFKLDMGPFGYNVCILDPDYVEKILMSNTSTYKGSLYTMFTEWIGRGLITSNGSLWKTNRKLISPIFSTKLLNDCTNTFNEHNKKMIDNLKTKVGTCFDIFDDINKNSFNSMFSTLLTSSVNFGLEKEIQKYSENCHAVIDMAMRRYTSYKRIDKLFKMSSDYQTQKRCIEENRTLIYKLMDISRKVEANAGESLEKSTFLDLILKVQREENSELTDLDIAQQIDTFMFAGHDTVSAAVSHGVYELSKSPELQERILAESNEILGSDKRADITMRAIEEFKYLDLVVKEILRKYPSAPILERTACEPITLGEYVIPVGTNINIMPYVMHNLEILYPNPEKFDPDRFLPENKAKRHPYSYLPFSHGQRNCIGQRFSLLEVKSTLIDLVRNFVISPGYPDFEVQLGTRGILQTMNGILVKLEIRE